MRSHVRPGRLPWNPRRVLVLHEEESVPDAAFSGHVRLVAGTCTRFSVLSRCAMKEIYSSGYDLTCVISGGAWNYFPRKACVSLKFSGALARTEVRIHGFRICRGSR